VTYAVITSGQAGECFPDTPRDEVGGVREAEQTAAAKCVGVTDLRFLRREDGRLTPSIELRRDISRVIRQVRPDRVVIQSPERSWERIYASHPDHLAAGEAAIAAVYPDARNPYAHPELLADEGLEAWTAREVWIMASPQSAHAVDITDVFDRKLAALQSHASQVGGHTDLEGMLRGWGAAVGAKAGLPEGRLAEVFQVIETG
jgi:LmbE family N-acetylglucosaminyl deacetylase